MKGISLVLALWVYDGMHHFEILVEEPSMKALLEEILPKMLDDSSFEIRVFNGKPALLRELPHRLKGYAAMKKSMQSLRVVVLIDRDQEDCRKLRERIDQVGSAAGLNPSSLSQDVKGDLVAVVVCEELEAWYFGDVGALRKCYPRLPDQLGNRRAYRDTDHIRGGTAEALERVLQSHGYFLGGLAKMNLSRDVAPHMNIDENRSKSFNYFRRSLAYALSEVM